MGSLYAFHGRQRWQLPSPGVLPVRAGGWIRSDVPAFGRHILLRGHVDTVTRRGRWIAGLKSFKLKNEAAPREWAQLFSFPLKQSLFEFFLVRSFRMLFSRLRKRGLASLACAHTQQELERGRQDRSLVTYLAVRARGVRRRRVGWDSSISSGCSWCE